MIQYILLTWAYITHCLCALFIEYPSLSSQPYEPSLPDLPVFCPTDFSHVTSCTCCLFLVYCTPDIILPVPCPCYMLYTLSIMSHVYLVYHIWYLTPCRPFWPAASPIRETGESIERHPKKMRDSGGNLCVHGSAELRGKLWSAAATAQGGREQRNRQHLIPALCTFVDRARVRAHVDWHF